MSMVRTLHRHGALVLGLYALVHLANHVAAVRGVASHIAFMEAVRVITRVPLLEALLLACVLAQVVTGLVFLLRRRRQARAPREAIRTHSAAPGQARRHARIQVLSGAYLAFFLLVHVASLLITRFTTDLDTNFYFAAAGLHVAPFPYFFVPYYGLAVLALCVHLAGGLVRLWPGGAGSMRPWTIRAGVLAGLALAGLILAAFGGILHPVVIPAGYVANLQALLR